MSELTRRGLLARAGLATGAVALGKIERADASPDLTDWAAVRAQFALSQDRVQLTSFLLASHPRPVRQAIDRQVTPPPAAGRNGRNPPPRAAGTAGP